MMESALVVSCTEKNTISFTELLNAASINHIVSLKSVTEARRSLLERDFDLVVVDAPLRDESGESFSRQIAVKSISQVLLVVNNEYFDEISSICEADGVLTVSKPVNREMFWSALTLAKSAQNKLKLMLARDPKLRQKIEDIRIVNRAKGILISHLGMSEQEAHKFIEKQAMNLRSTRRVIAEGILKTYEN